MKKYLFFVIAGVLTGMMFSACNQTKSEYPGYTKTADGLYYKLITKSNDTVKPKASDYLDLYMDYGTLAPDSLLFSSKKMKEHSMNIPLRPSVFKGDIYEGLALMHVGDSMRILCNADSVFGKLFHMPKPKGLDSAKEVYFNLKLLAVKTAAQVQHEQMAKMEAAKSKEVPAREAYLKEHKITTKPTADGLYIIVTKKGHGAHPKKGDNVKVHYTGTLLNGEVFDSSIKRGKPFEFPLGQNRVIKGWDEGIATMRKGEKATLIIPSELAYGQRQMGPIPPYSTLIFDVELIDFSKGTPKETKKK